MAMTLDNVTPLDRLGMVTPLGRLGRLSMVIPLGKLGGLTPRGSELSNAGMVMPRGKLGKLARDPGIFEVTPEAVLREVEAKETERRGMKGKPPSSFFPTFLSLTPAALHLLTYIKKMSFLYK